MMGYLSRAMSAVMLVSSLIAPAACRRAAPPAAAPEVRNVVLVTIDTLRADRVGAYGYPAARTPVLDALARTGTRFEHAYATAPITLTSHASLLSGRYPPGHGVRHNGIRVRDDVPLLAEAFAKAGFATAAFVGAFPLDRRFGLERGFTVYGDRMPRAGGTSANERPGRAVVDEAIEWLKTAANSRIFVWVHLFEPHAPYGRAGDGRPVQLRYDDEVAEADVQIGRLLEAMPSRAGTLVVVAADHGEAFGEHGEIAHSVFVYDTTLRVPLVFNGPGISANVSRSNVGLIDVAGTVARLAGVGSFDSDGIDLSPALRGGTITASRRLYAESFAPLLDFGWSALRSIREDGWKYIDAPRPELYDLRADPGEERDVANAEAPHVAAARERVNGYSAATMESPRSPADPEAVARLQALGYLGTGADRRGPRADPKDRRQLAAEIARITSGELQGSALEAALRDVLTSDPGNPQMNMRLGFVLADSNRCGDALNAFARAIAGGLPGADPYLGAARCQAGMRLLDRAIVSLRAADKAEPDNPVVLANLGIVMSDRGLAAESVEPLRRAVRLDPEFHEARFNLALAYARSGQREDAAREATELLRRLPEDAPQRSEVARLLAAVRGQSPFP